MASAKDQQSQPLAEKAKPPAIMGRPRSPEANARMLRATLEVLAERGFSGLTVNEICTRAGVSRTTFYRRWPDPSDAVAEAITDAFEGVTVRGADHPADYLVQYTLAIEEVYADPLIAPSIGFAVGEMRANSRVADAVQGQVRVRRAEVRRYLEAMPPTPGVTFGLGVDIVLEIVSGMVWSAVVSHARLDHKMLRAVIDRLIA
jgi:AcrR family transcriptional regulator